MSDYNFLMESRLSPEQFQIVNQLSRIAADQGLNLYLAGGAVRDLTFGQQTVRDLDFTVEGNPEKILRRLESAQPLVRRSAEPGALAVEAAPFSAEHLKFDSKTGCAEVGFTHGVRAEIAMARNEVYTKPGRRPEITSGTIFEDLRRRDFSINAMAVSLHPNSRGLLLDPTNGAADIEKRELRVLHNRSLSEDPSRIYRMLRLGWRLGFKPEAKTSNLLEAAFENHAWERMEPEQQGRELRAILYEQHPERVLKRLAGRGLFAGLDRKLASGRLPYDQFARIRSVAQSVPAADPFLLNFHGLVSRLGPGHRKRLAKKIIPHLKLIKQALSLERDAHKLARVLRSSKAALPSQVYKLLSTQPQYLLLFLLVHYPQRKIQKRVRSFLLRFPQVRARMPRAELQAIGMKPGPRFEKILERLFLDQLDGKIKPHQQLAKEFRKLAGIPEPKPPKPGKPKKPAKPEKPKKAEKPKKPEKTAKPKGAEPAVRPSKQARKK